MVELLSLRSGFAGSAGRSAHLIFPVDAVGVQPTTRRRSVGASSSVFRADIRFAAHLNWGDEAIAAPLDIYDEPIAIAPIARCPTQRGNMDPKVGRLDEYLGPNPTHQSRQCGRGD
jgi:hypothetical protein